MLIYLCTGPGNTVYCSEVWCSWQAVMVVADSKQSLTITGNGDVLEPHDGVIGTGGARSACA